MMFVIYFGIVHCTCKRGFGSDIAMCDHALSLREQFPNVVFLT